MRFVGIDIASETHVVAAVAEDGAVLLKPVSFQEDGAGYELLWEKLGSHYSANTLSVRSARGQVRLVALRGVRSGAFGRPDSV